MLYKASVLRCVIREMFYLTTHSTHFIYGYMASDIWLRTILIVRKETRCRHIGYSYRLTARVLLYALSNIQDNTYHGHCYTSRGALAGTRNSSMGPRHEGSIQRPIAPWANALPVSYVPLPCIIHADDNRITRYNQFMKYTLYDEWQKVNGTICLGYLVHSCETLRWFKHYMKGIWKTGNLQNWYDLTDKTASVQK